MPFAAFYDLHEQLVKDGVWETALVKGAAPFDLIDCHLLLLGSLAFLGCHIHWEHISDLNGISITQNRDFFDAFIEWGHKKARQHIKLPEHSSDIQAVMGQYERLHFPGCIGSMDGVHFWWNGCPAGLANECKG